MVGFVGSLSATWRTLLLRFALAFVVLALAWWARDLGADSGTGWKPTRSFFDPATNGPLLFRVELWNGYASYDLILLAALILATPGWSLRQRGRLFVLGLVLVTLTESAFFLSTIK